MSEAIASYVRSPDPLVAAAEALLGVHYLFPYQRLVIANIIQAAKATGIRLNWPEGVARAEAEEEAELEEGEDSFQDDGTELAHQIVILPTGAGKSLCFQLPALLMDRPTLVLFPILSLMADQFRRLSERGCEPVILRGGQDKAERQKIWKRLEAGSARFIIANPEVLLTEAVMRRLPYLHIAHLVLDEAHCISEWGESFRPSYLPIAQIIEATRAPLVTAFTATASPSVLEKIEKYVFSGFSAQRIIGNPDRPNIEYSAKGAILRDIAVRDALQKMEKPAIVFCSSRAGTERLARFLRRELATNDVYFYHAGLERGEKKEVEDWFFTSKSGILTATCAYGMGVDKANIRTVIHRDCPPTIEAYLQESGRAGRDGEKSYAVLLWGPDDESAGSRIKNEGDKSRFEALLSYARSCTRCRRESLLSLLGTETGPCVDKDFACDVCRGRATDTLREIHSILHFIKRNTRSYSLFEASRIIAENGGLGITEDESRLVLRYLLKTGQIREAKNPLWKGRLSFRNHHHPLVQELAQAQLF